MTNLVWIDEGHGGHDSGATGHGLLEKDVVLEIGNLLAHDIAFRYENVKVRRTRTDDTFVFLNHRADRANTAGADIFVSLHNNAFNKNARGFETFVWNGSVSDKTRAAQKIIHDHLMGVLPKDVPNRGTKQDNFSVLRRTKMPAVLIEYLFIDQFDDNLILKDTTWLRRMAQATADGIAVHLQLEKKPIG